MLKNIRKPITPYWSEELEQACNMKAKVVNSLV